jgi:hypothetical protein
MSTPTVKNEIHLESYPWLVCAGILRGKKKSLSDHRFAKAAKQKAKSATCDIQKIKGASRFELETCRSAVDRSTTELYALIFIEVT